MSRRVRFVVLAALLVCTAGGLGLATGAGGYGPTATAIDSSPDLASPPDDFARTNFVITLYENGSATWATRHTKPLNDTNRADFEAYATEFNATNVSLYDQFRSVAGQLTTDGQNVTDRRMTATNFRKRAFVREDPFTSGAQGVVDMRFLWSNFTAVEGSTIRLGDVFQGGIFIGSAQGIEIRAGPNLTFQSVDPAPTSMESPDSLTESQWLLWEGPQDFSDQRPFAELTRAPTVSTTASTTATPTQSTPLTQSTPPTTTSEPTVTTAGGPEIPSTTPVQADNGGSMLVVGVILLLLVLGTLVVWWVVSDSDSETGPSPTVSDAGDDAGGAVAKATDAKSETTTTDEAETTQGPVTPTTPSEAATAAGDQSDVEQQAPAVSDEDLLSDTDRVQQLLEDNGGRMRQSAIVKETEWSKSKVSMLLSDMADEDEITKLRVGRENIISLPGHEPEAAGSPFEDEQ